MSRARSLVFAALALLPAGPLFGQSYTFRHYAGSPGGASYEDGTGSAARFNRPSAVAVDAAGNVYVADTGNHTIRKVTPQGVVTTLAGLAGESGAVDGPGATARFRQPRGVVLDEVGNLYVADTGNHAIRRISPDGVVSTFAGVLGVSGSADGPAAAALFQGPRGLARDAGGSIYVADTLNQTIRKVSFEGAVSTLAGFPGSVGESDGLGGAARFQTPTAVGVDGAGNVYVADSANHTIRKVTQAGEVTTYSGEPGTIGSDDGPRQFAHYQYPQGITAAADGTVWVADTSNHTVRRINPAGVVETMGGQSGKSGTADGAGNVARFLLPAGVALAPDGSVVVADTGNHTLRRVVPDGAPGTVSTLAGSGINTGGADGVAASAQFNGPAAIAIDGANTVYVAEEINHIVRKVAPDGTVSTMAGLAATPGLNDGLGSAARFRAPAGIAVDAGGNVYVADTGNHTIRKVTPNGGVTTLAGMPGVSGTANGTGSAARFNMPHALQVDASGNVYVADTGNHSIRKITPAGEVTTFAGQNGSRGSTDATGAAARFSSPEGLTLTAAGTFYVADTGNSTIRRMTAAAEVTTVAGSPGREGSTDAAGSEARFDEPRGVAVESGGTLLVADSGNQAIRRIRGSGVITVAGLAGAPASTAGTGTDARFADPRAIVIDSIGRVVVLDSGNHALKRGVPTLQDKARIDAESGATGQERQLETVPKTGVSFEWVLARRPAGSTAELSNPLVSNPRFTPDVADLYIFKLTVLSATGASITLVPLAACGAAAPPPVIVRTAGRVPSCAGESVTLDAGAGYQSYLWSSGETTRTITVSPATTTTYSVTITSEVSCGVATGSITQTVAEPLSAATIALSGTPGPCANAAGLTASASVVGGGNVAHQWGYRIVSGGPIAPILGETSATYTIDPLQFPVPGHYLLVDIATPSCGLALASNEIEIDVSPGRATRLVPIVLDVDTGSAHFTTELALTNRSARDLAITLTYTAALGTRQGSGTVSQNLVAGQQLVIPDVLGYLRGKGLAIPASSEVPQQGGTLLVDFGTAPADAVAATARTTAATADPQPVGAAGLAYPGLGACEGSTAPVVLHGLLSNDADRSNVAVYNPADEPVVVKISVTSGAGDGRTVVVRAAESMPPYGWLQVSRILDGTGIANGWATVERVSPTGTFAAYAVLNDNATNDGSFVEGRPASLAGGDPLADTIAVPVLVEIRDPRFGSELFLANRAATPVTFTLGYAESLSPSQGAGGSLTLTLAAGEQRVFPEAIDYLRSFAGGIGPRGAADYAGALFVRVAGAPLSQVSAGARTSALSPAGGRFGLFTPGLTPDELASDEAWLYGLAADGLKRSNVAVVNAGAPSAGPILLELVAYDGDARGAVVGTPATVALNPGQWTQLGGFLRAQGAGNGWVRIRRISGTAPWLAYGVVNDGGQPGQRTGDGAYVPMAR